MIVSNIGSSASKGALPTRHGGLTPIKKNKKLEKKRRLESIRRNRRITVIQAYWRGQLARRQVHPSPSNQDKLKSNNNEDNDDEEVHEKPESESEHEQKQLNVVEVVEEEEKPESESVNEQEQEQEQPNVEKELNSPAQNKNKLFGAVTKVIKKEKTNKPHLQSMQSDADRKASLMINNEKLLSLAAKNEADAEANTIKQIVIAVIMLIVYFGFGMFFYSKTFKISYFRAFYFNIITVTTIGYGEISPDTDFTKLITAVNIFAGLSVFTIAITFIMDFLAKEKELLDELLIKKKFEEENKIEMNVKSGVEEEDSDDDDENASVGSNMFEEVYHRYNCYTRCIPEQIREALWNMFMAVLTIMVTDLSGAIFFMFVVDDLTFVDAVYFCAVTISSVGYGDILPESDRARLFIIFYGIFGTGMTANALSKFSAGISLLINYDKSKEDEPEEDGLGEEVFALMDSDGDGQVVKAEFMLYKLVRMGLVKPEHLKSCSEQFAALDFDDNGYLSQEDVEAFNEAMKKNQRKKRKKEKGGGSMRASTRSGGDVNSSRESPRRSPRRSPRQQQEEVPS